MQIEGIEKQWTKLCRQRSAAKKYFDTDHPLELLYGADALGRAVIALITDNRIAVDDLSRDVTIGTAQRQDGKWATTWTLTDSILLPTFIRLGVDVASRSKSPTAGLPPLESLLTAFAQWQLLLRPPPPKRLTLELLRGLVGELWAGNEVISKGRVMTEIVQAWSGPRGGAQDFIFPSGEAWEVKAKRSNANTVRISSAEQLDSDGKSLRLVILDLDERSSNVQGARSLIHLATDYRLALASSPIERDLFDGLIASQGVDLTDSYYADTCFVLQGVSIFRVDEDFPCLRRSNVPETVTKLTYDLNVSSLGDWSV